ncbi:ABC transporter permease [Rothia sp. AR01]|uniref:ABC transporter permease n=1 Tax=Rothia santali TaxID=2949643 RepID=A0A9X2HB41_9MICC|nr:ABC transporter permease [Rothia santali]MCP3426374.1 ABC transporter permease [Rothia santali]
MADSATERRRSGSVAETAGPAAGGEASGGETSPGRGSSPGNGTPPDAAAGARSALRRSRRLRLALQAGVLVVVLLAWWLVTAVQLVPPLYLPSPGAVWHAFVQANTCRPIAEGLSRTVCGEQNYYLWEHLVASLQRIGVGVGAAIVLGLVAGFLLGSSRWLQVAFEPYLNFLRALPPLGYIGLLIVWLGIGDTSKFVLLFLAAFPPIVIATIQGVAGVSEDRVNAARALGASRGQIARFVVLPSSLPNIFSGVRIAAGFAWTTVVAAELNNGIPGIGGLAYLSGTQLNTPLTIACIITIGLVAVALDAIIVRLGRLLVPWQGKA